MSCRLFIRFRNLNPAAAPSENELKTIFSKYGSIVEIDRRAKFCFLEYEEHSSAQQAIDGENEKAYMDGSLEVQLAQGTRKKSKEEIEAEMLPPPSIPGQSSFAKSEWIALAARSGTADRSPDTVSDTTASQESTKAAGEEAQAKSKDLASSTSSSTETPPGGPTVTGDSGTQWIPLQRSSKNLPSTSRPSREEKEPSSSRHAKVTRDRSREETVHSSSRHAQVKRDRSREETVHSSSRHAQVTRDRSRDAVNNVPQTSASAAYHSASLGTASGGQFPVLSSGSHLPPPPKPFQGLYSLPETAPLPRPSPELYSLPEPTREWSPYGPRRPVEPLREQYLVRGASEETSAMGRGTKERSPFIEPVPDWYALQESIKSAQKGASKQADPDSSVKQPSPPSGSVSQKPPLRSCLKSRPAESRPADQSVKDTSLQGRIAELTQLSSSVAHWLKGNSTIANTVPLQQASLKAVDKGEISSADSVSNSSKKRANIESYSTVPAKSIKKDLNQDLRPQEQLSPSDLSKLKEAQNVGSISSPRDDVTTSLQQDAKAKTASGSMCDIFIKDTTQRGYAKSVALLLENLGLSVRVCLLATNADIMHEIEGTIERGTSFAVTFTDVQADHDSITVFILHGEPEEHRNMLLEDGLSLIAKSFAEYKRCKDLKIRQLINRLAADDTMSFDELGDIITYLQHRQQALTDSSIKPVESMPLKVSDVRESGNHMAGSNPKDTFSAGKPSVQDVPKEAADKDHWLQKVKGFLYSGR